MNRSALKPIFVSLGIFVLLFAGVALYLINASQKTITTQNASEQQVSPSSPIDPSKKTDLPVAKQVVGGDLKVVGSANIVDGLSTSSVTITPLSTASRLKAGQLYSDNTHSLLYFDGKSSMDISGLKNVRGDVTQLSATVQELVSTQPSAGVVTLQGQSGDLVLTGGDGVAIEGTRVSNTGVVTIQGKSGNVMFSAGDGVSIVGTTIYNDGVTSIGSMKGDVTVGDGLGLFGGALVNTGVTHLVSGSSDIVITDNGTGTYTVGYAGSGVGGTVALGPNVAQQDASTNPSLYINKTGTGNLIQLSTGSTPVNRFVVDQAGSIISGSISFNQLTSVPSLVNSIGGLNGTIPLGNGLTVSGGSIVATTAVSNLIGTANQVNVTGSGTLTLSLPQDIGVNSTPTFAGLNLGYALTVASGGTGASNAASARTNLGAAKSGANNDITSITGLTSALSISQGGTGATSFAANTLVIGQGTSSLGTLSTSSANQCLVTGAGGSLGFQSCPGAAVVNSLNGSSGSLTLTAVNPASIITSGTTITIQDASTTVKGLASFNGSNFTVSGGAVNTVQDIGTAATPTFGSLTLNSALSVANGGTGVNSLAANSILVGQGTAAVGTIATALANQCLVTGTGGSLGFAACPGSTGVSSFNGLNGAVTFATVTASSLLASGSTITLQDATASTKGLAAFNSANLVVTGGSVNTIQNISITSTPTFAGINLTNALSVTNGGTGVASLTANGVLIGNGTSPVTGLAASAASQCLVSASDGTLSFETCPGSGGVASFNNITGAVTFNTVSPTSISTIGNTVTVNDATSSVKGLASFNGTNFSVVGGAVNTIQNIGTAASPTFAGLTLSGALGIASGGTGAANPASARTNLGAASRGANSDITSLTNVSSIESTTGLTVGSTSQALALQGSSATLSVNSGGYTSQLSIVTPTANVAYRLQSAAAGTYDVCTTAGNCVGTGGSVNTAGGTVGKISRFVSGSAIGDSIMTDDGSKVSIAGALSVNTITPTAAAIIGATTQSLTLQGSSTAITATDSGNTNTLQFNTPSGANKTILIPNASGTVAVSATGPIVLGADGNLTCPSCLTTGGSGGTGGVTSVNGASGTLTITSVTGSSITTSGTTITVNDATSSVKGLAAFNNTNLVVTSGVVNTIQNISTTATPTFAGLTLTTPLSVASGGTGLTSYPANSLVIGSGTGGLTTLSATGASQCLASQPDGSLVFVSCPGASVVNYLNGLNGTLTIEAASPSSITTSGTSITINDATSAVKGLAAFDSTNFTVTGGVVDTIQDISTTAAPTFSSLTLTNALSLANGGTGATTAAAARTNLLAAQRGANSDITSLSGLTTPLSVAQGGTGATSLSANGVLIGNGTSAVSTVNSSVANQCLISASDGTLGFDTCPGDGGVASVNGETGTITIAAVSPSSITTSSGTITINDASTTVKGLASFNGGNFSVLNGAVNTVQNISTGASPTFAGLALSSALGVASGGTGGSSFPTNGVLIGQGTSAVATVGTSSANQCLVSGSGGSLSFAACPGASGVSSLNGLNGAITLSTVAGASLTTVGNTITISDASDTVKGLASFNSANLTVSSGAVNTVQNIGTTASPTFAGLTLTGALSVASGGTGASSFTTDRVLLGNGASAIAVSNTAANGYCFRGNATGAPTFQACPVGGNISSGAAQTAGRVTMFDTTTNLITNSVISQAGTAVTVAGNLSATAFTGDGSELSALSATNVATGTLADLRLSSNVTLQGNTFNGSGNLVKLDVGGQAVTDGMCLKSTNSGTGTAFSACSAVDTSTLANRSLSNLSNVAINDILLPGVSNSIDIGSSTLAFKSLYLGSNITAAGTVNGLSLSTGGVAATGALSISSGGTNNALTLASTGTGNLVLNKNSGNIVLNGFNCSGSVNFGKLTADASGVLACSDDISGVAISGTATDGRITKFNAGGQILNSNLSESGTTLTYSGNAAINAASGFTGNLLNVSLNGVNRLSVTEAGNVAIAGTLSVSGASTLASLGVTGNSTIGGTLGVTGAIQTGSNLIGTADDTFMSFDAGSNRIGMTKKSGGSGKFTFGSGESFAIAQSSGVTIAASNTFTTRFEIQNTGDANINTGGLRTGGTLRIANDGTLSNIKFGAAAGALVTNSSGTVSSAAPGVAGLCFMSNGNTVLPTFQTCPSGGGGGSAFSNGGNVYTTNPGTATSRISTSYDAAITNPVLGLSSNSALDIVTNNNSRINIQANGDVSVLSNSGGSTKKFTVRNLNDGSTDNYINTLVVDTSSDVAGRVGIGLRVTTSPQVTLDIGGGVADRGGSGVQIRGSSAPGVSIFGSAGVGNGSTGRLYYDATDRKFKVSENGGAYTDLVQGSGGAASYLNGGNSFGTTGVIGTNDSYGLSVKTNNATRLTIDNQGDAVYNLNGYFDFKNGATTLVRVDKWNNSLLVGTTTSVGGAGLNVGSKVNATGYSVSGVSGLTLSCGSGAQALGGFSFTGGILTSGGCYANNSDLAEAYNSSDSLEAGELVMASGTAATSVSRATGVSEGALMGIVSTAPGQLIGTEQVPDGYPIALSGRVPTKVNTEGGPIQVGDKITISSVVGVGKKATSAGMVVGTAVESFSGSGTGSIEVFVNLMYYNPVDGDNLQATTGSFQDLNVSGNATINNLTVTGTAHFNGNIVVDGHIITGGNTPTASIQSGAGVGGSVSVNGNDTAGTITFTAGTSGATVGQLIQMNFTQGFAKTPRIIISAQDATSVQAMAFPSNKSTTGFGLSASQALIPGAVYTFDYFIVE